MQLHGFHGLELKYLGTPPIDVATLEELVNRAQPLYKTDQTI
jgi:hypothetical protein